MALDPSQISQFSVIRIPFDFMDGEGPTPKRFVLLGHVAPMGVCFCCKSTSKLDRYRSSSEVRNCCLLVNDEKPAIFEVPTAIDLSNSFTIPYSTLARHEKAGALEVLGVLDHLTLEMFESCALACKTMPEERKKKLRAVMRGEFVPPEMNQVISNLMNRS